MKSWADEAGAGTRRGPGHEAEVGVSVGAAADGELRGRACLSMFFVEYFYGCGAAA